MKIIIPFLLFISITTSAQYNKLRHSTCNVAITKTGGNEPVYQSLLKTLKERGYKYFELSKNEKMVSGDIHLALTVETSGRGYKECYVEVLMQKAKRVYPSKKDPILFKDHMRRMHPRHTFKGQERCNMAYKDISFRIPTCL